jgi:uncharacterized coiled-coil protein SlyX
LPSFCLPLHSFLPKHSLKQRASYIFSRGKNNSISINRGIFRLRASVYGYSMTMEKLSMTIGEPPMTMEEYSMTMEKLSMTIAEPSMTIEECSMTMEKLSMTIAEPSMTMEECSMTMGKLSMTMKIGKL